VSEYVSSRSMSTRYPVEVIRSDRRTKTVSARIVDGVIRVRIPGWMTADDEAGYVDDIVRRIEQKRRSHAVDLGSRAQRLANEFGLPAPNSIKWVGNQNQRWGSCTIGTADIRISDRLVDVPPWVLDHVIVHELAHLVVPDHSPAFDELLARNPLSERAIGYLMALTDRVAEPRPAATPARPAQAV